MFSKKSRLILLNFFQPIINPKTDTIRSAEALLRWENPASYKYGLENIIKVLESTGLILPLGKWIISTALKHLRDGKNASLTCTLI